MRLFAREKGYLNVGTKLLESVLGGHMESVFWASSPGLLGPGSLVLRSPAFTANTPAAANVMLAPKNRRLEKSRLRGAGTESVRRPAGVTMCFEGRCNFIVFFLSFRPGSIGIRIDNRDTRRARDLRTQKGLFQRFVAG